MKNFYEMRKVCVCVCVRNASGANVNKMTIAIFGKKSIFYSFLE